MAWDPSRRVDWARLAPIVVLFFLAWLGTEALLGRGVTGVADAIVGTVAFVLVCVAFIKLGFWGDPGSRDDRED